MLQFYYDFIDKYLNRSLYKINKTDTDSLYMSLTGNSVKELVPLEKRQAFEAEKCLWFVTPQAPQGKRTPGLFKVEYTDTKMVSLCSKNYKSIEDTDYGTVKFSIRRVNKNQFDNPMTHYQETLETTATFRVTNLGIRRKGLDMTTYSLMKDALTYFYPKRKVLEDGRTTVPLDI